jgi:hypothetical protein
MDLLTDEKGNRVTNNENTRNLLRHAIDDRETTDGPRRMRGTPVAMPRRGARAVIVAVSLMLSVALPSAASAGQARLFSGSFGEASSSPADPYPLGGVESIAVDNTSGDVYVGDPGAFRIEKFDATGHFLLMIGSDVNQTAVEAGASRSSETGVCPALGHPLDVCQPGTPGASPGAFLNPQFLAVDNSTGSSKGDLYVGNTGEVNEVQEVTVTATGGTFRLGFEGETTSPLAFNAKPDEAGINAALHAHLQMLGIESGGAPEKFTLEFTNSEGELGGENVPQVTCDGSGLTGPGASCVVTTKREGFSANLVEKFGPEGQLVTSWGEGGAFDAASLTSPPAPLGGPFVHVHGLAVDPSGNLWVSALNKVSLAQEKVFEFDSEASFLAGWTGEFGELAVDAADNLYFNGFGAVRQYSSAGKEIGVVGPAATEVKQEEFSGEQETVDPAASSLYLAGSEGSNQEGTRHGIVKRYDLTTCHPVITHEPPEPGCAALESFGGELLGASSKHPLAINSLTDALYVADQAHVIAFSYLTVPDLTTTSVANPTSTAATITGTVNPDGVELDPGLTGCRFEWGTTPAPYEHTAPCNEPAAQIGSGTTPVEVHASISGLQAGTTYHYRLVAANPNDVNASITEPSFGTDVSFGPPRLESESALNATASDATLEAAVDPNGLDTSVRIEYGVEAGSYTSSTPASDIGAADAVQAPTFTLIGLAPGSTYHYRVVAENVLGEGTEATVGSDRTVTTQTSASVLLPDRRGWELVSPTAKHGAIIKPPSGLHLIQAASDGGAITYTSSSPTEPDAAGNADEVQILSARGGGGWASSDLATPNIYPRGGSNPPEYKIFSSDLSLGIVEPGGELDPEMSDEASEQTPFLRDSFTADPATTFCSSDCYRPIVTGAPGFANVPPETKFGRIEHSQSELRVTVEGASADGRHIVVFSYASLIEGAPLGRLYEWTEGHLQLVSILPHEAGASEAPVELGGRNALHAVSTSGARVIWTEIGSKGHLYETNTEVQQSVQLDVNHGGSGKGPVSPKYQNASTDGSTVFFTDEQQITPDSGAAPHDPDLYRCRIIVTESGEECELTDLTPAHGGAAGSMQGGILGASEDGSTVYFAANGVLAANQVENGAGSEQAQPGTCGNSELERVGVARCNLYVEHDGATSFIATLSSVDRPDFGPAGPADASPDGRWLTFMSERSLTGYDNRDRQTGEPAAEVYLYDSSATSGALHCISCDPTGVRPHGEAYLQLEVPRGRNNDLGWDGGELVSGFLPASATTSEESGDFTYKVRSVTDAGRVFFNSIDGLVPQDANGTEDVYQFEPVGVGTCELDGSSYLARAAGCVDLLSSGASEDESVFLDSSTSGGDAFFETTAKLSSRDLDRAADVYDARVGGGDAAPEKPIECLGDACQGFVTPPSDATPGSLIFSGPGNLKPLAPVSTKVRKTIKKKCPKGKRLERKKCVTVRRARHKSKHGKSTKRKARTRG